MFDIVGNGIMLRCSLSREILLDKAIVAVIVEEVEVVQSIQAMRQNVVLNRQIVLKNLLGNGSVLDFIYIYRTIFMLVNNIGKHQHLVIDETRLKKNHFPLAGKHFPS